MRLGKAHQLSTWVLHLFMFYREKIFRRSFPIMLAITLYALVVIYLNKSTKIFGRIGHSDLGQFHLVFSFILGILISFRVNTAYSRWWEGRVLWGVVVNNCRNLGLKFENFIGLENHPEFYSYLRAFPVVLKLHLRKDKSKINSEFASLGLTPEVDNPILFLTNNLYRIINQLRNSEKLRFEQYMSLETNLANLIDTTGGCERIANTPTPTSFAFFIKHALLFYSLIFPFGWVDKFGYLVIPMILMIVYILVGLEILAEDLEEPFLSSDNDLPLDSIAKSIVRNVSDIAKQNT